MKPDLKVVAFYTPDQVAALFCHEGDRRFAYRHSRNRGFLAPHARRFGRTLLFDRVGIDGLIQGQSRD